LSHLREFKHGIVELMASPDDPRVLRTRRTVLDAALAILRAEGPEAVTHLRLASETGVARATIYLHWPQRTHLVLDAFAAMPFPQTLPTTGDLRSDLLAALETLRSSLAEKPLVAVLLELLSRAETDPQVAEARRALGTRADAALRTVLTDAVAQGHLTVPDVDTAISRLLGPLVFRRLAQGLPLHDVFLAEVVDAFLREHAQPVGPDPGASAARAG
jgi:AcrR family transcriptional regulator